MTGSKDDGEARVPDWTGGQKVPVGCPQGNKMLLIGLSDGFDQIERKSKPRAVSFGMN